MIVPILRLLSSRLTAMPPDRLLRAGARWGWGLGAVFRFRRRLVLEALGRSFPDKPPAELARLADAMYRNLGMNLAESLRLDTIGPEFMERWVDTSDAARFLEVFRQGRGVVALTAHLGNFDLLCLASGIVGIPLTIISKELKPPRLNAYWMAARSRYGLKVVPHRHSARACLRVLRDRGVLGFILDQNMKRHEGIFVDFFGRPACTSPGLAVLSSQAGSPVVPIFIVRRADGGHKVIVQDPLEPPPDRRPETIRDATQRYTRIIEDMVRQYPDQWLWIHRRWKTRPQ
jgi:KDO2-lipid IV(A) lauroyltransferase